MDRIRVMVVDDHEVVRKHVCALLASQPDLDVICEASDGFDAVRQAQAKQPDVVLLDISLPGLNGLQAAALIKNAAPSAQILFFSQHENPYFLREAFAVGGSGYVAKVDAIELMSAIKAVHAKQRFVSHRLRSALNVESPLHAG